MLTVPAAFEKFRSRLEVTEQEARSAASRQRQIRDRVEAGLDPGAVADDFLTGSYRRETKTKPLRDVDIMVVLSDGGLTVRPPREPLDRVQEILAGHYGEGNVRVDVRAVRVDFQAVPTSEEPDPVMSFDVVPAVAAGDSYLIPDAELGTWITTNPKVHADLARDANDALDGKWKPVVKMAKAWNRNAGHPIESSFLLEAMALELVRGPWGGSWPMEVRALLGTAADRVTETWPDPAGVGPDLVQAWDGVSCAAVPYLRRAEGACTEAMRLDRASRTGDALQVWQDLFGPMFSKS